MLFNKNRKFIDNIIIEHNAFLLAHPTKKKKNSLFNHRNTRNKKIINI